MDLELEYVKYMLKISPEDAKEIASRVNNFIIEQESNIKIFKAAHDEYVENIKKYTTGDEMYLTNWECINYLREVKGPVYEVLSLYTNFRFKLQVSDLKAKLRKKF